MMKKKRITLFLLAFLPLLLTGQNPYLPLWEHVPDGEPRVFEDPDRPGNYRVYIVGSHDTHNSNYCGIDVHMWSAPVEDLSQWREEGAIFTYQIDGLWDTMYAPDIVEVKDKQTGKKTYWLYPHSRGDNRVGMVLKGIPNGGVVGFKYFGFGGLQQDAKGVRAFPGTKKGDGTMLNLFLMPRTSNAFRIHVRLGKHEMALVDVPVGAERAVSAYQVAVPKVEGLQGKHAIYLVAEGEDGKALFNLYGIGFSKTDTPCCQPIVPTVNITIDGKSLVLPKQPVFATHENGVTQTNSYQLRAPLHQGSVIKAVASVPDVKVEISPVTDGRASIRCTYQGQEKIFLIN